MTEKWRVVESCSGYRVYEVPKDEYPTEESVLELIKSDPRAGVFVADVGETFFHIDEIGLVDE